jgi:hypothetical protein
VRLSDMPHAGDVVQEEGEREPRWPRAREARPWSEATGREDVVRAVALHLMVTTFVFSYYYEFIKLCSCLAPSWPPLPTRPASFVEPTPSGNPHSISPTGRQVC